MTKGINKIGHEIRRLLVLSTTHVSPGAQVWLETMGWANAKGEEFPSTHMVASYRDGWIVRVPTDPEVNDGNFHADLLAIALEAEKSQCSHFMLDRDAEVIGSLPVYEDDENSLDGFSEEEKAAMALADAGGLHDELDDENPFDPESPEGRAYRDGRLDTITHDVLGNELPAGLSEEDRENWLVEAADKKERRAVIHPEDGLPLEEGLSMPTINTEAMIASGEAYVIRGVTVLSIMGILLLLQRLDVDAGLIQLISNRLREAAETRVQARAKAKLFAEVRAAANDILEEITSEIEQRQHGGNDEVWKPLEAKRARLEAALAAI